MSETAPHQAMHYSAAGEAFLKAGVVLIRQSGPEGLSLSQILRLAGKPRGSFYAAFSNKAIFEREVVRRFFQPAYEVLLSCAENHHLTGREKLRGWASATIQRVSLAIQRSEHVTTLTELMSRNHASTDMITLCNSLLQDRVTVLSRILIDAKLTENIETDDTGYAFILLVMLDSVESMASINKMSSLLNQFFEYHFSLTNNLNGEYYDTCKRF